MFKLEPIWKYIENCKKSLFRFEGLQDYSAEDGDKLAELPNDTNEWWRKMKERNKQGIITQRVRLVTEPLTDYTKMELVYLKEAKKYSGDNIRIIEEKDFKEIAPNGLKDFWMIDDKYVFVMEYGPKGKYLKSDITKETQKYIDLKERLLKASKSL